MALGPAQNISGIMLTWPEGLNTFGIDNLRHKRICILEGIHVQMYID